ncbi:MAG: ABC transporter permease [Candidatus Adiutrix sp.]|jgi:spermidine/putrescine transport system permease protein|nr:ABC transporter permease [Candidatus Adiutrix sp.]
MNFSLRTKKGHCLLLPSAAFFFCLSLIPLSMLVVFSFLDGNLNSDGSFPGFTAANYVRMFSKTMFARLMGRSLLIGLTVTLICVALAYPTAWGIAKVVREKNRNMLVMLAIVPFFTSQLLLIYAMMVILQSRGFLMSLMGWLGAADPSGSILYSLPAVVVVLVYEYLPYMILCLYASLEGIPDDLVQASRAMGAGRLETFVNIILPLSMPGLLSGIMLVLIPATGSFVEPGLVGGSGGMMIGSLINSQFNTVLDMGYGSALSFVFLVCLSLIMFMIRALSVKANRAIGGMA